MTFGTPLALLALAGLPVLVYAYLARRHRQAQVRAAFASPVLAASHTPRDEGARRHLPFALYAVALAALVIAAAKPQRSVAVPVERASIMLMTDVSGSMLAKDVAPTRLVAARRAQEAFVTEDPRPREHRRHGLQPAGERAAVADAGPRRRPVRRSAA